MLFHFLFLNIMLVYTGVAKYLRKLTWKKTTYVILAHSFRGFHPGSIVSGAVVEAEHHGEGSCGRVKLLTHGIQEAKWDTEERTGTLILPARSCPQGPASSTGPHLLVARAAVDWATHEVRTVMIQLPLWALPLYKRKSLQYMSRWGYFIFKLWHICSRIAKAT